MFSARDLLRDLLGEIVLRPTSEGLIAELRGNGEGLLAFEEALPGLTGNSGSGGSTHIVSAVPPRGYLGRVD